jgi:hypothetical protein
MVKGLSKKVEPKVGSKGSWSDGEVTVIGIKKALNLLTRSTTEKPIQPKQCTFPLSGSMKTSSRRLRQAV